jgi:hypothetical protein
MLLWGARDGTGGARPWCPIKCGEHPGRDTIASSVTRSVRKSRRWCWYRTAFNWARRQRRRTRQGSHDPVTFGILLWEARDRTGAASHGASVNTKGELGQTALHLVLDGNRSGPDGVSYRTSITGARRRRERKDSDRRHHYTWHPTMGSLRLDGCCLSMVQMLTQRTSGPNPVAYVVIVAIRRR